MKNFQITVLFCFVLLFSCKEKLIGQVATKTIEPISAEKLKTKISKNKVQLIDVRTPNEYANGHITGATNINFYDSNFLSQMEKLDKDKPVYLYCRSAVRSGKAANKLKEEGFSKVYDLSGGILAWKSKGLALETKE